MRLELQDALGSGRTIRVLELPRARVLLEIVDKLEPAEGVQVKLEGDAVTQLRDLLLAVAPLPPRGSAEALERINRTGAELCSVIRALTRAVDESEDLEPDQAEHMRDRLERVRLLLGVAG